MLILCLEPGATILYRQITYLQCSASPRAQLNGSYSFVSSDMERYEGKIEAKKRRVENCDRLAAAGSLIALSEDGNGSVYCEPHTGLCTSTTLTMADIEN